MPWLMLLSPRMWFFGAIALLLLALGVQTMRLDHAKSALVQEQASRAKVELARAEAATEYAQKVGVLERAHAETQQRLADDFQTQKNQLAADVASARADGDSLRADIDRFTAARASGTAVDAATARRLADRAITLGQLFGEADSLAESLARAAEQRNAEVRALKRQLAADRAACGEEK